MGRARPRRVPAAATTAALVLALLGGVCVARGEPAGEVGATPPAPVLPGGGGVAVCLTGAARTIGRPAVYESVSRHLLSDNSTRLFAAVHLGEADPPDRPAAARTARAVLARLCASNATVSLQGPELGRCHTTGRVEEVAKSQPSEDRMRRAVLNQFAEAALCLPMVEAYERARGGLRFEWVLHARPDYLWVDSPFSRAPPGGFDRGAVTADGHHIDVVQVVPRELASRALGLWGACVAVTGEGGAMDIGAFDVESLYRNYLEGWATLRLEWFTSPGVVARKTQSSLRAHYFCKEGLPPEVGISERQCMGLVFGGMGEARRVQEELARRRARAGMPPPPPPRPSCAASTHKAHGRRGAWYWR